MRSWGKRSGFESSLWVRTVGLKYNYLGVGNASDCDLLGVTVAGNLERKSVIRSGLRFYQN